MAISRAAMTGVRNGVMKTLGPNLSRVVRAATAAIAVIGSGTGMGDDSRSENHTESISLFSQTSTNCQKKSRPAGPAGPGPCITPMRYLMRITLPAFGEDDTTTRRLSCHRKGGAASHRPLDVRGQS